MSDEAIEAAMQTLGLQFQDLLNQNNLANLVAELTGADSVPQLLCSEQFVNVLQSVNSRGGGRSAARQCRCAQYCP